MAARQRREAEPQCPRAAGVKSGVRCWLGEEKEVPGGACRDWVGRVTDAGGRLEREDAALRGGKGAGGGSSHVTSLAARARLVEGGEGDGMGLTQQIHSGKIIFSSLPPPPPLKGNFHGGAQGEKVLVGCRLALIEGDAITRPAGRVMWRRRVSGWGGEW